MCGFGRAGKRAPKAVLSRALLEACHVFHVAMRDAEQCESVWAPQPHPAAAMRERECHSDTPGRAPAELGSLHRRSRSRANGQARSILVMATRSVARSDVPTALFAPCWASGSCEEVLLYVHDGVGSGVFHG